MDALKQSWILRALAGGALLLAGCQSVTSTFKAEDAGVVYALGSRDAFTSPLQKALAPAGPSLAFDATRFDLSGAHQKILLDLAAEWKSGKPRYLIAGYAAASLAEDYARSLTDRRAQAARQFLIEHGVEAANLQAVGFGNDVAPPGQPAANVVVIYRQ